MSLKSLQPNKLGPAAKCNLCFFTFYEQVCSSTGTVMCPNVEEAIKHCIKSETYLETVSRGSRASNETFVKHSLHSFTLKI